MENKPTIEEVMEQIINRKNKIVDLAEKLDVPYNVANYITSLEERILSLETSVYSAQKTLD